MTDIGCVIFDLGGVLIELDGPPLAPREAGVSEQNIWHAWLHSETVRSYESGQCSTEAFAAGLIDEMQLDMRPADVINHFTQWPKGWYPGAEALLKRLKPRIQLACLSNTNHVHWQRFDSEQALPRYFHQVIASFQVGMMKPDPGIFEHTIRLLRRPAGQLLFLDDNPTNIKAARSHGIQAEVTRGPLEAIRHLKSYGLL